MNCETCKYWNQEGFTLATNGNKSPNEANNHKAGTCRFDSPWPTGGWRAWPVTIAIDFCHRHAGAEVLIAPQPIGLPGEVIEDKPSAIPWPMSRKKKKSS
jgi:hypothetical protein